jgi:hypothetical protein
MADNKGARMVPESDLIAAKKAGEHREKVLRDQLAQVSQSVSRLENELKIAKANGEDNDEVRKVKELLLEQDRVLEEKRSKYEQDLASVSDRERKARARELVVDLKGKGVEVEVDTLLGAEDMDRHSKDLLVEFQAKEIERLKAQPAKGTPESVFDLGNGGVTKKSIKDIDVSTPEGRKELEAVGRQLAAATAK